MSESSLRCAARAALVLVCASSLLACEGSIDYRGAVVASPTPGWAFSDDANPEHLAPVPGATVTFCVCNEACACDGSPADAPHVRSVKSQTTDARGAYDVSQFVANDVVHPEHYVVRATAPGYEPLVYARSEHATDASEPLTGKRWLVLRLRPAPTPPAP